MTTENSADVVVGVDGSTGGVGAACWAAGLADACGAHLHLVHSLPSMGHHVSDASMIAIRAAASEDQRAIGERFLHRATEVVTRRHPEVTVTTECLDEPIAEGLVRASKRAEVVVVGCEDVNPAAALLVGSTSLAVATHAACPVVVWRNVATPDDRPVLVGVDDTPAGTTALETAFGYAERLGVPVRAVHAWRYALEAGRVAIPYVIDWEAVKAAEARFLHTAVAPLRDRHPDVDVECRVVQGKPSSALLQQCADAQLVVVGNHRRSALTSVVLGSTPLNLLHHSPIPVMVCHAEQR